MNELQIIVLALLQGFTEFLPISSSAHLILVPYFTAWSDQGLAFDVAVHVGSLGAVLWYFRRDLGPLLQAWARSLRGLHSAQSRLVWAVGLGTLPVAVAGLLLGDLVDSYLRSPLVIAWATIGFGLLLGWSDWIGKRERDEYQLRSLDIIFIGLAQALALIPGTSRSGITMTAALLLGFKRQAAARYSFLLSIPVILLAGSLKTLEMVERGTPADWNAMLWGALLSGLAAYMCIHFFIRLLDRIGMIPFVIYRLALGGLLLVWLSV